MIATKETTTSNAATTAVIVASGMYTVQHICTKYGRHLGFVVKARASYYVSAKGIHEVCYCTVYLVLANKSVPMLKLYCCAFDDILLHLREESSVDQCTYCIQ